MGLGNEAVEAWVRSLGLIERSMVRSGGIPESWYRLACCRALVGDQEGAILALERAVEEQAFDATWAQMDPDLASIRDEPRARAAIERMMESGIQIRGG